MPKPAVTIIGAGLVGSLLATLLVQRGFNVEVFERRVDPRRHGFLRGRSINLSLVERGLRPLRLTGLAEAVLAQTVTMVGRRVHMADGTTNLQRYGINDDEVEHSVGRGALNTLLLDAAERAGARLHFDTALIGADFENGTLSLGDHGGNAHEHHADLVLGCDGAGSTLRATMAAATDLGMRVEPLGHGYKELEIPALMLSPRLRGENLSPKCPRSRRPEGQENASSTARVQPQPASANGGDDLPIFAVDPHALHIWPRGNYMCIALPNTERNFTVTLFLPNEGKHPSFATLPDIASARALFTTQFSDLLALMPCFDVDWNANPIGQLATLYLDRWHVGGRALLLGDAAHALVPFHGQGMNAGFEDAAELAALMTTTESGPELFAEFQRRRKPNADAIATMSLANYVDMRDGVADSHYLLKRKLATGLAARAPGHFMSRYRMVSFTTLPYTFCAERDAAQTQLMEAILLGHRGIDEVDLDQAAARVRTELPALSTGSAT